MPSVGDPRLKRAEVVFRRDFREGVDALRVGPKDGRLGIDADAARHLRALPATRHARILQRTRCRRRTHANPVARAATRSTLPNALTRRNHDGKGGADERI